MNRGGRCDRERDQSPCILLERECVLYELKALLLLKGSITSWWFQIEEQDFGRQSTSE